MSKIKYVLSPGCETICIWNISRDVKKLNWSPTARREWITYLYFSWQQREKTKVRKSWKMLSAASLQTVGCITFINHMCSNYRHSRHYSYYFFYVSNFGLLRLLLYQRTNCILFSFTVFVRHCKWKLFSSHISIQRQRCHGLRCLSGNKSSKWRQRIHSRKWLLLKSSIAQTCIGGQVKTRGPTDIEVRENIALASAASVIRKCIKGVPVLILCLSAPKFCNWTTFPSTYWQKDLRIR